MRKEKGWTSHEAFAHQIDLDRSNVSSIKRGARNPPLKSSPGAPKAWGGEACPATVNAQLISSKRPSNHLHQLLIRLVRTMRTK